MPDGWELDGEAAKQYHGSEDPHKGRGKAVLADVILGGQDGLVNVLGVILGVAAATNSTQVVLAAGFAAMFAESVAMAGVAYTSTRAEQSHYESEEAREKRHIDTVPALEREEVRWIYEQKGFSGALLDQIVEKVTSNPEIWVREMMSQEHSLEPKRPQQAWRSMFVVGLSALVGSIIPLLPFLLMPIMPAVVASLIVSAVTLFGVGFYKARTMVGHPWRSGLEIAAIGMVSAFIGYGVGLLFKT